MTLLILAVVVIAAVVSAKFRKFVFTGLAVLVGVLWFGGELTRQSDEAARHQRIRDRALGRPEVRAYQEQFVRPAFPGESQESVPRLPSDKGYTYAAPQQWPHESAYPSGRIYPAPVDIFADDRRNANASAMPANDGPLEYTDDTPNSYGGGNSSWPGSSWTDPGQGGGNPYANGR